MTEAPIARSDRTTARPEKDQDGSLLDELSERLATPRVLREAIRTREASSCRRSVSAARPKRTS